MSRIPSIGRLAKAIFQRSMPVAFTALLFGLSAPCLGAETETPGETRHASEIPHPASPSSPDGGPTLAPPPSEHRGLRVALDERKAAPADAVRNLDTGATFSSLAAAVAAAVAGETLRVEAKALVEAPITIDKNLVIEGATGSETIYAAQDTGASGDARGWFLVENGVDLAVRDLGFDGNGFRVYQAFRHQGTGVLERVRFHDIRFDPSTAYQGTAIVAFGGRVDVRDSVFTEIGRVGVLFFGTGVVGAVAERNVYVGKGDGDFLDYGIEVGAGADVVLWNNAIRDCRGVASADGSGSAAIQLTTAFGAGTTALVQANQLLRSSNGATLGVASAGSDGSAASFAFNRLVDNDFGLVTVSSNAVDAERNWWGCNAGPGAPGCDEIFTVGTAGAVDSDPWLVLRLEASPGTSPGASPGTTAEIGQPVALEANLHFDSDGDSTILSRPPVSGNVVADGIPVGFAGVVGVIDPSIATTLGGAATATFTPTAAGSARVFASVDHQSVEVDFEVVDSRIFVDGFESGDVSAWSSSAEAISARLSGRRAARASGPAGR